MSERLCPFEREIWTAQKCADYLGQSYSQFTKRTQHLGGFPARCPMPGQPRWSALAVTAWALGERDAPPITHDTEAQS